MANVADQALYSVIRDLHLSIQIINTSCQQSNANALHSQ